MKMKKLLAILLALLLLTACSAPAAGPEVSEEPAPAPLVEEASSAAEPEPQPEPQPEPAAPQQPEEDLSASQPAGEPPAESSTAEAPLPESSAAEPQPEPEPQPEEEPEEEHEPEEEPEEAPAPAAPAFVRPDYLGVGAPALKGDAEYLGDVEYAVLEGINEEREAVGAAPVQWDDNLADAARIRAAELYHNEYVAHQRPNGDKWTTVLNDDVPVNYSSAGEILAAISTQANYAKIEDPYYWVNQWVNSETHYSCMTTAKYTHAGTAVVYAYDEEEGLYHGYACTLFAAW